MTSEFTPRFTPWYEYSACAAPTTAEEERTWLQERAWLRLLIAVPPRNGIRLLAYRDSYGDAMAVTADEIELARNHPVTWGNILWRRKIMGLRDRGAEEFKREYPEYPSTPEDIQG